MFSRTVLLACTFAIAGVSGAVAQRAPLEITLNGNFLPDPSIVNLVAGGSRPIQGDLIQGGPGDCLGFTAPDDPQQLLLTYRGTRTLTLTFNSTIDTTLFVVFFPSDGGESIIECDDDGGPRLNPSVTFNTGRPGLYAVAVGTLAGGEATGTLYISEVGHTGP